MTTITPLSGQSFFDLSAQVSGTIENAFVLSKAAGLSVTDIPAAGVPITYDESLLVINKPVLDYYIKNNISPATAFDIGIDSPAGLDNEFLEYPEPALTLN